MIDALIDLTARGTVMFLLVVAVEAAFASSTKATGRRWWWYCVPVAFLFSWKIPILPPLTGGMPVGGGEISILGARLPVMATFTAAPTSHNVSGLLLVLWLAGAIVSLALLFWRTWEISRQWSRERLSTDSELLSLLEECKILADVTAPIGLVVTDRLESPAILGWLRPRILLPRVLVESLGSERLSHVLLHELAHFRSMDVPVGWAFALVRCVHWFNPFAYLAEKRWGRLREEAADERAMDWSAEASPLHYGKTLVAMIRQTSASLPFGALGITETFPNLKRRLLMITKYPHKTMKPVVTFAAFLLLASLAALRPVSAQEADPKAAAVAAMQVWLKGIDDGKYAESWTNAAPSFQQAITSEDWVKALNGVRTPLGECKSRKLASAVHQTGPLKDGRTIEGGWVTAQFDTSFTNLAYAVETVTFEPDNGVWKAAGYFIKPK